MKNCALLLALSFFSTWTLFAMSNSGLIFAQSQIGQMNERFLAFISEIAHKESVIKSTEKFIEVKRDIELLSQELEKIQKSISEKAIYFENLVERVRNKHVGLTFDKIRTIDGNHYKNVKILRIEVDGIVISHSSGVSKINSLNFEPDLKEKLGFDN